MKAFKVWGFVFLIVSGLFYTLERGFSMLSTSLIRAGFFSGQMTGEVPNVETNGFFGNFFTPLFFGVGLILIIYGFFNKHPANGEL